MTIEHLPDYLLYLIEHVIQSACVYARSRPMEHAHVANIALQLLLFTSAEVAMPARRRG